MSPESTAAQGAGAWVEGGPRAPARLPRCIRIWWMTDGWVRHAAHAWTGSTLYRASVTYDASRDAIQFFVSGQGPGTSWRLGYVDYRLADVLRAREHASSAPIASPPSDQSAEP